MKIHQSHIVKYPKTSKFQIKHLFDKEYSYSIQQ